jgi:acyl carrier protein
MNISVCGRVQNICADVFALSAEQITLESSPQTISTWDSLQHLNLVLAIEQEFGTQFAPEEIEQMLSVQHIVDLLAAKLSPSDYSL